MSGTIVSVGTAVPGNRITQEEIKAAVKHIFGTRMPHLDRLLTIFEHSDIESRHSCMPLEWFLVPHTVEEKHRLFVEHAVRLSEAAVRQCLNRAGLRPADIDHIVFVTTTGTATPSLDAHLCNRMGFRTDVKRTPLWGLGCAGGAAGLSRASEYAAAFPDQLCLVVSVELCTLTFILDDASKSNIVATSLFADGAAAAVVAGERRAGGATRPHIRATQSTIWPDSLDVMGWEITNDGMKVVFSKDIPTLIQGTMKENVETLIATQGARLEDIRHYVLHPGGMKVLRAYESALHIPEGRLSASEKVLRNFGNMSSCTVLFVLDEILSRSDPKPGEYGLAGALGPGFSSELLFLQF